MNDKESFGRRMKRRLLRPAPSWQLPPDNQSYITARSPLPVTKATIRKALNVEPGAALGKGERGAIWPIVPSEAFEGDKFVISQWDVPHVDIRSALMFFDKFDVPTQPFFHMSRWCDEEFRKAGILLPSTFKGKISSATELRDFPFEALLSRDRIEPGRWALSRPAQAFGIPIDRLSPQSGVALTLQNALPTFTRDVEIEEILEFKERSWSELIALRTHLDELVIEIGVNGVNSIEHNIVYNRFVSALKDHIRLMNQSNREKVWHSLRASCDLPSAAAPAVEMLWSGTIDYGTLAAGAITVGIRTVQGLTRKRNPLSPFEYLTSAHLEL